MSILLVGSEKDPHLKIIGDRMKKIGQSLIFVDFTKDMSPVCYRFCTNSIEAELNCIKNLNITAMYWRPAINSESYDQQYTVKELCTYQEYWNHFFPFDHIKKIKSINPVDSSTKMENKIYQLKAAIESGFKIPNTLISCDIKKISQFISENKTCIQKSLGMNWDENDHPTSTKTITLSDLEVNMLLPMIYQEKIVRKKELRVYVVGKSIIPVEVIVSEKDKNTPDWRSCMPEFRITQLDNNTLYKIQLYLKKSKLIYGAFDLMVNENDEVIFLECNPSGNWFFLNDDIREEIVSAIANELVSVEETQ